MRRRQTTKYALLHTFMALKGRQTVWLHQGDEPAWHKPELTVARDCGKVNHQFDAAVGFHFHVSFFCSCVRPYLASNFMTAC
jgi:hypothetical protein